MGLMQRPTKPKSKEYDNWFKEARKIKQKAHGNVGIEWADDAKGIKRTKDAQRNKMGQGSPRLHKN